MLKKIRYEELFPHEMEEIMKEKPIAYLPFGTFEWHSLHLALGIDAVKVHEICLRVAEKAGGIVVPATYWAAGGMPHPWTTRFDTSFIEKLFYEIFSQMDHVGFKVVIAITGHYGLEQLYALKKAACDYMYKSNLIIIPMPEYEVAYEKGYLGEHAAKWETSLLWAVRPELVDMSLLGKNLEKIPDGVMGADPRLHASRQLGEETVNHIVDRLSKMSHRLLHGTNSLDRSRLIRALNLQVKILEKAMKTPMEELSLTPQIRTEEYKSFIDNLWRGNYVEAIEKGEGIFISAREVKK